jgi:uncharacterized protein YaeQ
MAIKAIIHKANLQIADMDRNVYVDHAVTIARHPSETDERMIDEPALWHKDLTGEIKHWIDVGQPDEKRLLRASGRADRVAVYSFSASTPIWWAGLANKITRANNIAVWQIDAAQSQSLATLAQRSMQLQISVQDGTVYLGDGERAAEITPERLNPS